MTGTTNLVKMTFPHEYMNHRYSMIHFNFFMQYARVAPVEVEFSQNDDRVWISNEELTFSILVDGRQVIIDYADHWDRNWKRNYPNLLYFKFQRTDESHPDTIPLGPPMVGVKKKGTKGATLREYNDLKWNYDYQPGDAILCKQLPNGAATERRNQVHEILQSAFDNVDIDANVNQMVFWKMHEKCLAAVCVPGATNHMVDRGQIELIGLGVCTVSPRLDTIFPFNQKLVPNKHYVECSGDYSDLVDILRDLKQDPDRCKEVGSNARQFYDEFYAPKKYWQWIYQNVKGDNNG